jgi:hypothetical protein
MLIFFLSRSLIISQNNPYLKWTQFIVYVLFQNIDMIPFLRQILNFQQKIEVSNWWRWQYNFCNIQ